MKNALLPNILFEIEYFDYDDFITFYVLDIDSDNMKITVEVSNRGRIYPASFSLQHKKDNIYYFDFDSFSRVEFECDSDYLED